MSAQDTDRRFAFSTDQQFELMFGRGVTDIQAEQGKAAHAIIPILYGDRLDLPEQSRMLGSQITPAAPYLAVGISTREPSRWRRMRTWLTRPWRALAEIWRG